MGQERPCSPPHLSEYLGLSKGEDKVSPEMSRAAVEPVGVLGLLLSLRPLASKPEAMCMCRSSSISKERRGVGNQSLQLRHHFVSTEGHIPHIFSLIPKGRIWSLPAWVQSMPKKATA